MLKPRAELTEQELTDALEACANEPIHIPGAIQPYGFLIAVHEKSYLVSYVSQNIDEFVNYKAADCLNKHIENILGQGAISDVRDILIDHEQQPIQSKIIDVNGKEYDMAAHMSGQNIVMEFEPRKQNHAERIKEFYDETRNFSMGVHKAKNLEDLYQHVVDSVRSLTGIDRVKLYKFDEEWNGSVISQSKADHMTSYLDMRFPASDIPEQARILYTKNYLRIIPDIYYAPVDLISTKQQPLDLSLSMLRSVSPVHVQYLDNMKIRASMSISIIQNGKLWGLIACHHNAPLYIPYQARMVAEIMGHIFSAQLSTLENQVRESDREAQINFIESLKYSLHHNPHFTELINATSDLALNAMRADGLAAIIKGNLITHGNVPSQPVIHSLIEWLSKDQSERIVSVTDASRLGFEKLDGGFLAALVSQNRTDAVIWFRAPLIEEVQWAGNPEKPLEETKAGYRLTPRGSFDLWKQNVKERCAPWSSDNIDTAQNFVNILLESEKISAEEANLAKSEFLANMSHEIRTPMNAIVGITDLLSRTSPLTSRQKSFIETLHTSADALLALINDLLDISKIEAREIDLENIEFSMEEIIQQVVSLVSVRAQEKGLSFLVEDECVKKRMFLGDPNRIRQGILNLCSNAVKFTETGGISLDVYCHDLEDDALEELVIIVKDTGIGIPPDKLEHVFEKFEQADNSITRKYGGTGLGLAITKSLVEAMNGTISVKSHLGRGSQFTIALVLRKAHALPLVSKVETLKPEIDNLQQKYILLVEDYQPNILVAEMFLEEFGYSMDVASNGLEAIQKIKDGKFDAVIMDVQMPEMNGLEATKHIRDYEEKNGLKKTPIIGMTAHALSGDRERCLSVGMDDYISKPFDAAILENMLSYYTSVL